MKIFSSFKDYYDTSLIYGIDPNCIYKRETKLFTDKNVSSNEWNNLKLLYNKSISLFNDTFGSWNHYYYNTNYNILEYMLLLFCGKIYFATIVPINNKIYYCYNIKSLNKYFTPNYKEKYLSSLYNKHKLNMAKTQLVKVEQSLSKFYDLFPISSNIITDVLYKFEVPVVLFNFNKDLKLINIQLNPILKNIEFNKIVLPNIALQEISMFISGIMGGESPPMIQLSDTIRLEKKGFDKITSFRNM